VRPHADLLHSKGVGVIGVGGRRDRVALAAAAERGIHRGGHGHRGAAVAPLRGNEFGGDITTLSLAQPLNYFAPVVALDRYGPPRATNSSTRSPTSTASGPATRPSRARALSDYSLWDRRTN